MTKYLFTFADWSGIERKDGGAWQDEHIEYEGHLLMTESDSGCFEYYYGTMDDFINEHKGLEDAENLEQEDFKICLPRTNDTDVQNMHETYQKFECECDIEGCTHGIPPEVYFNLRYDCMLDDHDFDLIEEENYIKFENPATQN